MSVLHVSWSKNTEAGGYTGRMGWDFCRVLWSMALAGTLWLNYLFLNFFKKWQKQK